ncbi:class I SAM-dependent methyltransferase [Flavitalea flava]
MSQNILFYNEIAEEYDSILDQETVNRQVRQKMENYFLAFVKSGWVLDFGGGTGRDLEWLVANRFKVIFCEPSAGMRKKAIHQYKYGLSSPSSVHFLEDTDADFTGWGGRLPFSRKMDAVLSNFAVINSIPDIRMLFKHLSMVMHPGGQLIALVLENEKKDTVFNRISRRIRSLFFSKPVIMNVKYHEVRQTVYMHSLRDIRQASADCFDFVAFESLSGTTFSILHLARK